MRKRWPVVTFRAFRGPVQESLGRVFATSLKLLAFTGPDTLC